MATPRKRTSRIVRELRNGVSATDFAKVDAKLAISALIADAIPKHFVSKGEFAHAMGVSPGLVSRWLSGTHNFTIETLVDIQQVLGIRLINMGEFTPASVALGVIGVKGIVPSKEFHHESFYADTQELGMVASDTNSKYEPAS
jgi:transcriptional regulator with XRE-family HTH domain